MEILVVDVQPNHIRLFVSCRTAMSIANAVKLLQGISARQPRLMFSALQKRNGRSGPLPTQSQRTRSDRLWAPSYYVGTAEHVSAETIRKYIEAQETHHAK
jgi:putative transposase